MTQTGSKQDSLNYGKHDSGCHKATAFLGYQSLCLDCPFDECIYDAEPDLIVPKGKKKGRKPRGKPPLYISRGKIIETLKDSPNVKVASEMLGCSRGYIYKILGRETVRETVKLNMTQTQYIVSKPLSRELKAQYIVSGQNRRRERG